MTGPGINYTSSSLNRAKRARNPKKELPACPRVAPGYAPSQPRPLFAYLAPPLLGWDDGEDEVVGSEAGDDGADREGRDRGEKQKEGGVRSENGSEMEDGRSPINTHSHIQPSTRPKANNPNPAGSKSIPKKRTFDFGFSWAKPTLEGRPIGGSGKLVAKPRGERLGGMGGMRRSKGGEAHKVPAPWWMTWRGDELSKTYPKREARPAAETCHSKRPVSTPTPNTQHETKRPRRPPTPAALRRPLGTADPDVESSQSFSSSSPIRPDDIKPPPTPSHSQSSPSTSDEE